MRYFHFSSSNLSLYVPFIMKPAELEGEIPTTNSYSAPNREQSNVILV